MRNGIRFDRMSGRVAMGSLLFFVFLTASTVYGQTTPQCSDDAYGTSAERLDIETAMFSGSATDVNNAVNASKATRGTNCGCYSNACIDHTAVSNATPPSLATVISVWNNDHAPYFSSFSSTCPPVGRVWASQALAGYYAILAKATNSSINVPTLAQLASVATAFVNAQYGPATASPPYAYEMGAYPFVWLPTTDACSPLGVRGSTTTDSCGNTVSQDPDPIGTFCTAYSNLCPAYTAGTYSTKHFRVGDIDSATDFYEGDIGYDHGWAGIMMLESGIQQGNSAYSNSLQLAAQFAASEPPVVNFNYTAKLIWLLSEAYEWTGNPVYKAALLDKLSRGLLPGVLTDFQNAGYIDGLTSPQVAFSSLIDVAQPVGRMWDGHNTLPPYMPMNAWALAEAYVALHDTGDLTDAATVYSYLIPMLDNIASEINNHGVPHVHSSGAAYGVTQIPYALLIGLWKVSAIDGLAHSNWQDAMARLWNDQLSSFSSFGDQSVNVALYMLYLAHVPYTALSARGGAPPSMYPPYGYSVLSGTQSSGSLVSLFTDDSDLLSVGTSSTPQIGAAFYIPPITVHSLTIYATTKSSASGTARSLYLWDYTKASNNWTLIKTDTVGTTESTISQTVSTNVSNYIHNGTIQVGVQHAGGTMSVNFVQLQGT